MRRDIEYDLMRWKTSPIRLPLLLRGARQVGKTYVAEQFGRSQFENLVTVNFELQPEMIRCFDTLEPREIVSHLSLLLKQKIEPGKTLLFLDEIQDCPNAIRSLRYFKEKLPELHVIGAGSLLEFALNAADFRMPVGRVQSLYLKPLSFLEFLSATQNDELSQLITEVTPEKPIPAIIHQHLIKLMREYMVIGGMPAVVQAYIKQADMNACQELQTVLLNTYRQDFGKYASRSESRYLQRFFEKVPGLVASHFKYTHIDPEMRSRDLKVALDMLKYAGLLYIVYNTAASSLPLAALVNEKKFKLLFLDVGLVMRASGLAANILMQDDIMLANRGALAEQMVGQELLVYMPRAEESALYFWQREKSSSMAEIDFLTSVDSQIIPIEVKAGATGKLRSLRYFMEERKSPLGVRFSLQPLSHHQQILSLPIYLCSELPRLARLFI